MSLENTGRNLAVFGELTICFARFRCGTARAIMNMEVCFVRKSLFLTLVLALVLVAGGAVSAQSISAFGNVGYGKLSLTDEGKSLDDEIKGGVAFQAGAVYNWMDNFGVGVMYDRMTSSVELEEGQKVSHDLALSG